MASAAPQPSRPDGRPSRSSHGSGSRGPGGADRERRSSGERSDSRRGGEGGRERERRSEQRGDRDGSGREPRPSRDDAGSRREHRERRSEPGEREHRDRRSEAQAPPPGQPGDLDAWLDSAIDGGTDKRNDATAAAPREKIPKRPSSRADSRPREGRSGGEKSQPAERSRPPEAKEVQRPPAAPAPAPSAPAAPAATPARTRAAPKPDMPLSEVHSDDEIEGNENLRPNRQVARDHGKVVSPAKPMPANNRSPVNASVVEEDITVDTSVPAQRAKKDVSHDEIDEEVEYDEDFEEADDDDEEEYKPKTMVNPINIGAAKGSPSPEPLGPGRAMVSIRPDTASARAASPGINSGRDPSAMEDIKKAMENERKKAQMSNASAHNAVTQSGQKGFLADYESTMPKFNLVDGSQPSERAALQRLRDLKRLKFLERRQVEKIDLFSQRPQTAHSLFLAGKSLKYCRSKTVSCQTGEDDMEAGTMTDEVFMEDKEMQFPTLSSGHAGKAENEPTQMLPFLRRTLPLFEASLAESQRRQLPMHGQLGMAAESEPQRVRMHSIFGLPDSFISRCIDANVTIADVAVCPEWYGADHSVILYTWPWKQRPPPDSAHVLDAFTRPMQSIIALYPIISGSGGNIIHPARCLYSFCRLSSLVVVEGRSHIIVAGTEMGSLLVWDLREKARLPSETNRSGSDSSVPSFEPDPDVAHFQGALWSGAAFSTDSFTFSSAQDMEKPDEEIEDELSVGHKDGKVPGSGIHNVEICCVRCSQGSGSDPLIFALDLMGTVSFWRVLEFATMSGTQVKLALQGSISLPPALHSLGGFIDARALCIHPQQQMQFVVVGTSGVHQAHRHQRTATVSDGPGTFELLNRPDEDAFGPVTQPCSASFNPFFPGLLLVAYAEGDLALFDCVMCVPITHWSGAVSKAPNVNVSVAWSPVRPCVFFVKSLDTLDIWDLAEKGFAPVDSVELATHMGAPLGSASDTASELFVTAKGHPVVSYNGRTVVLNVSIGLTTPLQAAPPQHSKDERSIDTLLVSGCESMCVFPTLERYARKVDVPQACTIERDVMRRIVASIHPLQAHPMAAWAAPAEDAGYPVP